MDKIIIEFLDLIQEENKKEIQRGKKLIKAYDQLQQSIMTILKENELNLEEMEKELEDLRQDKVFALYEIDTHKKTIRTK